jgi:hypothetical protein
VKPYLDRVFSGDARGFIPEANFEEFYHTAAEREGMKTAEVWYPSPPISHGDGCSKRANHEGRCPLEGQDE